MNDLILYFARSGFSLATLYIFYWLFLQKETCFSCNRYYLIFSLFFSTFIPFIPNLITANYFISSKYAVLLEPVTIFPVNPLLGGSQNYNIFQILLWVYISGVIISILRLFFQLTQLVLLARKTGIHREYGVKVIYTGKPYANFSFFDIIFLNDPGKDKNRLQEIITHEKVHIRQKHYIDLIIIELMIIIFWFNPFIWFYKHSIRAVHEYLADEGVLKDGYNKKDYQKLLFNQTFGIQIYALTNNLNHSLIKRRFTMMSKSKTNKFAVLKMLVVIPLALFLVMAFSVTVSNSVIAQDIEIKEVKSEAKVIESEEEQVYRVVEQMPGFPGGDDARIKFLKKNLKYPDEARKQGISGTVFVSFVVEKDGSISNVKLLRGIGGGCDKEALRVVSMLPNYEPGLQDSKPVRTQFNLPISFKLNGGEKKVIKGEETNSDIPPPPPPPSPPPPPKK